MITQVITEFLENDEKNTKNILREWESEAEAWARVFCSIDNVEFRKNAQKNGTMPEFIYYLTRVYQSTVFYLNDKIRKQYDLLGIKEESLRWYTNLREIINALPPFESKGKFLMDTASSFLNIRFYFDQKIWDTLLREFDYVGKISRRETNMSEVELHKYILRTNARIKPAQSSVDLQI